MNAAADRLDDSYPHGTIAGYDGGCKGTVCPAGADHGLSCKKAKLLQASDYRYAKLARAGKTPGEIADELGLNPDPSAAPSKPTPAAVAKVTKKPTAKPVIDPYDDELDDEVLDENTDHPVDALAETAAQPLAESSQDRRPEHDAADEPAKGPAPAERDAEGIREEMGHLTVSMFTKGLSQRDSRAKGNEIREWIRTHGWPGVGGRGSVPQEALAAYAAAHDEATQEPTAPDLEPSTHVFVMGTTEPTMDNTGARSVPAPPPGSGRTKEELAEIRAWAAEVGMPCATFGRVPRAVLDAYAAAHHPDTEAKRAIAPMVPTTQPPALAEPREHELAGVAQALGGGEPSEVGPLASEQESHGGTVSEPSTDEDTTVITYDADEWPPRSEDAEALDTAHRSELLDEVRERIQRHPEETRGDAGATSSGRIADVMRNRPEWGEVAAAADVEKAREIAARLFLELTDAEAERDQALRALEFTLQKWSDAADRAIVVELRLSLSRGLVALLRGSRDASENRAIEYSDKLADAKDRAKRWEESATQLAEQAIGYRQRIADLERERDRLRQLIEAEAIATPRRRRRLRRTAG